MRRFAPFAFAILLAAFLAQPAGAADEDIVYPVAVRWWGQSMISIENWWGLTVVIDPYSLEIGYDDPQISAQYVCITHEHFDHNNEDLIRRKSSVHRGLENDAVRQGDLGFTHITNIDTAHLRAIANVQAGQVMATPPSMVNFRTIASFHDNKQGADLGLNAMFLVETDGVRILHCGDLGQHELTGEQIEEIGRVDVLCIPVGGVYTVDGPQAVGIVEQLHPRIVIPIHYKTKALTIGLDPPGPFFDALPDKYEVVRPTGNTLAVSTAGGPTRDKPQVVVLDYKPWTMPADLAELFDAKEAASKKSQETFRNLRVDQLNHKPSNGTHTPRWNNEHMLSAELRFFSSVYSSVDSSISQIRISPQQMPPDYIAAHPGWNGQDEAMQAQRVQDFTRRFAYLLGGMSLDELPDGAPGFIGDLRGLFKQMENHYGEHTAHVHEKFELEDWPE